MHAILNPSMGSDKVDRALRRSMLKLGGEAAFILTIARRSGRSTICVANPNRGTLRVAFDLKEIIAARLGENYQLHERHINRTLVAAQRVIGFDKVYARAEGAYLYDMDNQPYLDFLSGYSVFNIGRNHPVVKQAIRDVLDLDLPNMVQMDCSLVSGLLAEALVKRTPDRKSTRLNSSHGYISYAVFCLKKKIPTMFSA